MKSRCEDCRLRGYAEKKPDSLISKIWYWHIKWCPGWKSYQNELLKMSDKNNDHNTST